ncbi:hypothetical protein ROLI_026980 [Roseobacter fucihabitans]|uniref:HTH-like domain-containing protein n=1 Tax=Roseobacter fucihabitans TaxID=1537242 RepID=A0ABZ2BV58_9RHOB|nr:IS3 family transposase [Roseobacter litoralis]MBC6967182.1 hypothetical protein [Roseobacter litoralis]
MNPTERKAMIRKDLADLSLTKQFKLLKISRSSLYYVPVGVNAETLELMNEIDRVFTKYPFFGSRQIAAYLPRNRFRAGRHRVRRLMGIMGIQAIYKGLNTSKNTHSIASTPTCYGSYQSRAPTTFGVVISPTSSCGAGLVSGGDYGLGGAQGAGVAVVEHAGCHLLC